jgi:hypothetical protein
LGKNTHSYSYDLYSVTKGVYPLIIKTSEFELEITQGQIFIWDFERQDKYLSNGMRLPKGVRVELKSIAEQVEKLVQHSEELLLTTTNKMSSEH